eukprot:2704167-Lingulodinium_polyedra.AAC.1
MSSWLRGVEHYYAAITGEATPEDRGRPSRAVGPSFVWARAKVKQARAVQWQEAKALWWARHAAAVK